MSTPPPETTLYIYTYICACAMLRAKQGQQKVPIFKKKTGLCPSRSYYFMV